MAACVRKVRNCSDQVKSCAAIECSSVLVQKKKGIQGVIEIENPNMVKAKSIKAKDVDVWAPVFRFLLI